MKVKLEENFVADTVRIYIYDRVHESGASILRLEPGSTEKSGGVTIGRPAAFRWEEVPLSVTPEPTLELRTEALEKIVEAASDILPPSAAVDRHLSDATGVRDRLLAIVEGLFNEKGDTNA